MLMIYKLKCPHCGKDMKYTNLDLTQENPDRIELDLEFKFSGLVFECEECGKETYVNITIDYEEEEEPDAGLICWNCEEHFHPGDGYYIAEGEYHCEKCHDKLYTEEEWARLHQECLDENIQDYYYSTVDEGMLK